jgi:hypothetical protein
MKRNASILLTTALSACILVSASSAQAGVYPTNGCVSKKMKAAGKFCQKTLQAWSMWHRDPAADPTGMIRDASIGVAADSLSNTWMKAEASTAKKNADCSAISATATQLTDEVETAINALQSSLGSSADGADETCRSKALGAAAKLCTGLLKGNSKFIKAPARDLDKATLQANDNKVTTSFTTSYDKADDGCTSPIPASGDVLADVDELRDAVVEATTTSPNAPESFTQVVPDTTVIYQRQELSPRCQKNTPYSFFYKRGTTNKLLMYYQGGGACWSTASCWTVGTSKEEADAGDNPDLVGTGFADPDNMLNIFKDWHVVFVSYCTGDVHWGNHDQFYGSGQMTRHRGRINAAVAEKWAREHFIDPEFVFVTGSSAGSYGAIMNSAYLMHDVYPATRFAVLGDAGIGVITQSWLETYQDGSPTNGQVWGLQSSIPTFIPGIEPPIKDLSMGKVIEALADTFPNNRFASYESSYDGGDGGQTSFYHIMKSGSNLLDWTNWWEDQCEWTACMRDFTSTISAATPNYRYFTGAGSRHTIYGSDKLYTDTRGLVPPITFRDWVQAMIDDDVGWVNLDCADGGDCDLVDTCQGGASAGLACTTNTDCGTGKCELDPRPSPLAAPYEPGGVVNCPMTVCPCGPTGVNCP